MHLKTYTGTFSRDEVRARVEALLSEKWTAIDEGKDLFIERNQIDTTLIIRQTWRMRRENIPFTKGVLLRFHKNKVVASLRFSFTIHLFMFFAFSTLVLFLKGRAKPQELAFVLVSGGIFYYYVTDKILSELDQVFY
ncbi:MAG: hypothetical protein ACJ76H_00885 [Bacteriovoracaceae bacterium]